MNSNQLINFLVNVKGCNFASVTYQKEVTGVKRLLAPYGVTGTITKVATMQVNFNIDYGKAVEGRLEKSGSDASYTPDAPNGKRFVVFPKILENLAGTKKYARFFLVKNGKYERQYFCDNAPLKDDIVKIIEDHKATLSKGCQKQADAGLAESEQVNCIDITIENILSINIDKEKIIVAR